MEAEILQNELKNFEAINSQFSNFTRDNDYYFQSLLRIFGMGINDLHSIASDNGGFQGSEQNEIDAKNEIYLMLNRYHELAKRNKQRLEETLKYLDIISEQEENSLHISDLIQTINETEMDYFRFLTYLDVNQPAQLLNQSSTSTSTTQNETINQNPTDTTNSAKKRNTEQLNIQNSNYGSSRPYAKQQSPAQRPQISINTNRNQSHGQATNPTFTRPPPKNPLIQPNSPKPNQSKPPQLTISINQPASAKPNQQPSINTSIPVQMPNKNTNIVIQRPNSATKSLFDVPKKS